MDLVLNTHFFNKGSHADGQKFQTTGHCDFWLIWFSNSGWKSKTNEVEVAFIGYSKFALNSFIINTYFPQGENIILIIFNCDIFQLSEVNIVSKVFGSTWIFYIWSWIHAISLYTWLENPIEGVCTSMYTWPHPSLCVDFKIQLVSLPCATWFHGSSHCVGLCIRQCQRGKCNPYYQNLTHPSVSQFSSVAQSCPTLCDPMNPSTPGLPVHHKLPESTQTHAHWVSETMQPSHPLSSPSPPAPNPSQHQGLFQWVNSSHGVVKVLEFQLQHQFFQWTPWTDLL